MAIYRKPPILRQIITITTGTRAREYEVLVDMDDPTAAVLVASASQPGFWRLLRLPLGFRCTCPAFIYRARCAHAQAALEADMVAGRGRALEPTADLEFEAWLAALDAELTMDISQEAWGA